MNEWGVKWQYENKEQFEEAKAVALEAVAGFDVIFEPEIYRISFRSPFVEERFTIAYQAKDRRHNQW